jgi:small subunit ribosomal protein S3
MGQKVNPKSMRMILRKDWQSKWFATKKYQDFAFEDYLVRKMILNKLPAGSVGDIQIERKTGEININIHTSRPGIVIGRSGQGTSELKNLLAKKVKEKININIIEIRKPELHAYLVAQNIAYQIEKRVSYRRAAKQAIQRAVEAGARGIKVRVSGRLAGAEIARSEVFSVGSIPLQTLRAEIDYAQVDALTTYGTVGVKVWIYRGDVFEKEAISEQ